jgi:hypothetical protein
MACGRDTWNFERLCKGWSIRLPIGRNDQLRHPARGGRQQPRVSGRRGQRRVRPPVCAPNPARSLSGVPIFGSHEGTLWRPNSRRKERHHEPAGARLGLHQAATSFPSPVQARQVSRADGAAVNVELTIGELRALDERFPWVLPRASATPTCRRSRAEPSMCADKQTQRTPVPQWWPEDP